MYFLMCIKSKKFYNFEVSPTRQREERHGMKAKEWQMPRKATENEWQMLKKQQRISEKEQEKHRKVAETEWAMPKKVIKNEWERIGDTQSTARKWWETLKKAAGNKRKKKENELRKRLRRSKGRESGKTGERQRMSEKGWEKHREAAQKDWKIHK